MRRKGLLKSVVWITLLSLTVLLFAMGTSAANEGDYYYKVEDGEAIITDCKVSVSGAITLPTTLGGYPVTGIGSSAFAACTFLTDVTIPSCIESIGDYAFLGCTRLESVNVQGSVAIGDYVFRGCTALKDVTFASSVSEIGEHAFYSCNAIENVYISDIASWCGTSFADEYSNPLYYAENLYVNDTLTTDVVIPEGVEKISAYAFSSYSLGLNSVDIPSSVTSIGKYAFDGSYSAITTAGGIYYVDNWVVDCKPNATSVMIKTNTVGIADYAFSSCGSLVDMYFPSSVKYIGDYAFKYCSSMSQLYFEEGLVSIGDYAFYSCHGIGNLDFPTTLKTIGDYAFSGYHNMTKIKIPKNVTSIGKRAFNVNGVTEISVVSTNTTYRSENNCLIEKATNTLILGCDGSVIPEGIVKIADGAFAYAFFDTLNIPESVSLIENGAFDFTYGLESITVDLNNESYASIDNCLIEKSSNTLVLGCKNSLIPNDGSVTKIGKNAFLGCFDLMNAEIPSCVTEIEEGAFELCQNIQALRIFSRNCVIFDSADTICDSTVIFGYAGSTAEAYAQKYARTFEVIPEGQDENTITGTFGIDRMLSYNLNKKTGVLVISGEGKIPDYKIDSYTPWYSYRSLITSVVINDGVTKIGDFAFYGCEELTDIAIPSSIKLIGDAAFASCSSLTEITIPASVKKLGIAEKNEDGYELEEYYDLFVKSGLLYHLNFANAEESTSIIGGESYYDESVIAANRFAAASSNYLPYLVYLRSGITNPVRGGTATILYPHKFVSPYKYSYWFDEDGKLLHSGGSTSSADNFVTEPPSSIGLTPYAPNGVSVTTARNINGVDYTLYHCLYDAPATATDYYIADSVWGGAHYASSFGNGYFNLASGNDLFFGDGNVHQKIQVGKFYTVNLVMKAPASSSSSVALFMGPRYMLAPSTSKVTISTQNADTALVNDDSGFNSVSMTGINGTKITNYAFTVDASALSINKAVLGFYGNGISFGSQTVYSPTTEIPSLWQYHMYKAGAATYAIRMYEKVLSEAEVLQNNFADIALINRLDITKFLRLTEEEKLVVYNVFKGKTPEDGKEALQALLDANCDISGKAYGVFAACDSLEKLTVLSTDCVILEEALALEDTVLVYADAGSTMEEYAYANGNVFCDLAENTDENIIVGKFGPDYKFTFTVNKTTGELTVSGEGDLPDYSPSSLAPWYAYRSYINSLTVSEGITGIGSYAFYSCNLIDEIALPDTLVSISSYAFAQCNSLSSITIPKNVHSVVERAFNSNTLSSIAVAEGNTYYKASGNCLVEISSKKLVLGCADSVIPNDGSVTAIGNYAFYGCAGLSSLEIPDSITNIGSYAFALCTGLTDVTMPYELTNISSYAFSDCSALEDVLCLSAEIPTLGTGAFARCGALANIRVDSELVSDYKAASGWSDYSDIIVSYCTHEYTAETVSELYLKSVATCTEKAVYYKSCKNCGISSEGKAEEATFQYGETLPHAYTETVVAPKHFKEMSNGIGIYYKSCAICEANCAGEETELTFECRYGDVTGDGKVNGKDVVLIRQYLANYDYTTNTSTAEIKLGADVNGDGVVNATDVLLLRRYMANYNYQTGESSVQIGPQG